MKGSEILRKALKRKPAAPAPEPAVRVRQIPINRILPNPAQPRRSFNDEQLLRLAESIRTYGILQPLTVRFAGERPPGEGLPADGVYELIAGERRLRAARIAGLREVPCLIAAVDDRRSAEIALLENVQREDLNVFEQAAAIAALIDVYGLTQTEAASLLGISQSALANKIRLLRLSGAERRLILENGLGERHARALLKLTDPAQRLALLQTAVQKSLNVQQLEALIDRQLCPSDAPSGPAARPIPVRSGVRDLRVIANTIDRAVDTIERAGLTVAREQRESDDAVEFVIRVCRRTEGTPVKAAFPAAGSPASSTEKTAAG